MITARRERTLPYYLHELSRRRNSQGVPLLQNYQVNEFAKNMASAKTVALADCLNVYFRSFLNSGCVIIH